MYFIVRDYKEYNTDTAVHFIVIMNRDKLLELEKDGLHKAFKLQTTMTITSMVRSPIIDMPSRTFHNVNM